MSFFDLLTYEKNLNCFLNQLECLLLYCSDDGIIKDANETAINTLLLDPETYAGSSLGEHCRKNHFSLMKLFDDSTATDSDRVKETYTLKNGNASTILWEKLWLPFLAGDKKKACLLIGNDITKDQDSIEKLKESVHFYEDILSKLPTNVYWKDENSVYLGCNDRLAKVMNLPSRDAIKGMTDFDFNWGRDAAESFITFDKKVMETDEALTTEDMFKEASGSTVTVLTNKTPLKNKNGDTIGVLAISVDITERKQMETELRKAKIAAEAANLAKSVFIANMSHDVRSPVASIIALSEMWEREQKIENASEYSNVIHKTAEHLYSFLNDILGLASKHEVLEEDLKLETFDLINCIQHVSELLSASFKIKNIRLDTSIDDNLPKYIVSDRVKIDRILLNLVSNALKFTEKGTVKIAANLLSIHDGNAVIELIISDSGMGIAKNKIDKIFDRFYKVVPSYESKQGGYGIGLFIVKNFVTLLGGKIDVKSKLDKGSTFHVTLPLKIANEADIERPRSEDEMLLQKNFMGEETAALTTIIDSIHPIGERKGSKLRVLLIEDDDIARNTGKYYLKSAGFRVHGVPTGEQGIKAFKSESFDLIVSDVGLPGIDGGDIAVLVRFWEKKLGKQPVPIIGLSAHSSPELEAAVKEAGMNALFLKPLNDQKIAQLMNFLPEKKRKETEEEDPSPNAHTRISKRSL